MDITNLIQKFPEISDFFLFLSSENEKLQSFSNLLI